MSNTRQVVTYDYGEVTGLAVFNDCEVPGFSEPCDLTPAVQQNFEIDESVAQWVMVTLLSGDPLMLKGPPGAGKTSAVLQILGLLNWGVCIFRGSQTRDAIDLEGNPGPDSSGAWSFFDGPGVRAYAEGHFLLAEEFTDCDPSLGKEFHYLLDGTRLDIPARKGFSVPRHELFRAVMTGNRLTDADDKNGHFPASHDHASSTRSRMNVVEVTWLEAEKEYELMTRKYPDIDETHIKCFTGFAEMTRKCWEGAEDGNVENGRMTDVCTTRHVDRMCRSMHFTTDLQDVLKVCYLNSLSTTDREVAERLWESLYGA